ncbi:MAG: cyclic nucleotide-binding domain-containing protein [Bdellovibrionales bacterium]
MSNKSDILQNIYLFRRMTPSELEAVTKAATLQTYGAMGEIFAQQEKATALYVIKQGSVRIHQRSSLGDNIEVATLGAGSHFGEMGFVDGEPRSASASAIEKTEIVVFSYEKLRDMLTEYPTIAVKFYQELALFLCGRLRITTNDLSYAREKNLSHF